MLINNWRVGLTWPKVELKADDGDHGAVEYLYEDEHGETKSSFSNEQALAALLLSEAVFLNNHWWEEGWPEEARKSVALCVTTSDVFAWGAADAEDMSFAQIEEVYRYWVKDPRWGTAVWAMIKCKQMPQRPVEKAIREAGIWDLDSLGLRANHYDGLSKVLADLKREICSAWLESIGERPPARDAGWWRSWKEYAEANPTWEHFYKPEQDRRVAAWKQENGYGD